MRQTRMAWRASVRERREQRMIELLRAKVPFAEYKRELLAQEKEFLREARSPAERRRIQQLTAKDIITEAYVQALPRFPQKAEVDPIVRTSF